MVIIDLIIIGRAFRLVHHLELLTVAASVVGVDVDIVGRTVVLVVANVEADGVLLAVWMIGRFVVDRGDVVVVAEAVVERDTMR